MKRVCSSIRNIVVVILMTDGVHSCLIVYFIVQVSRTHVRHCPRVVMNSTSVLNSHTSNCFLSLVVLVLVVVVVVVVVVLGRGGR